MGSGARLRSDNQAFGRSRSGAFLLSAPGPEPPFTSCDYVGGALVTTNLGPTSGDVAASDGNCTCSTFPVVFEDRGFETRLSMLQQYGLGWEDPPHPAVRFTGQTSGAVIIVPEHCATQTCPGTANVPSYWEGYCTNNGATDADYVCIKSGLFNREGELPVTNQILYAYYALTGPGSPFIDGEDVLMEITYNAATLPDPGPYDIQSVTADPNFDPDRMHFTVDRDVRWTTQSVIEIAGTGTAYDGVWEAYAQSSQAFPALDVLEVIVPNYGPLGVGGTILRSYSQAWDCWHNDRSPITPKPDVPGGSTPQILTVGQPFVGSPEYGFKGGDYGSLAPVSWEGITIADLFGNTTSNLIQLSTVGDVPLYGINGVYLWVEGVFGGPDGRMAMAPVVPGAGTYTMINGSLADYFRDNLGNTLIIGISENV